LAKALKVNQTVATVDLMYNFIGDEGANALASMLAIRENLEYEGPGKEPVRLNEAREKIKHQNARNAVMELLLIFKQYKDVAKFKQLPDDKLTDAIAALDVHMLRMMAKLAWETRDDPSWLFDPEKQLGTERVARGQNGNVNVCIGCLDRIGLIAEKRNPTNIFCSPYCQFIHYHNLPDIRGMTPAEIRTAFAQK